MSFTTATFVALVATVWWAYWHLPRRAQNVLLILASYTFYGWWDPRFLVLIFGSTVVDFVVGRKLGSEAVAARRKLWVRTSLVVNLGLLGVFKYFGFFVDSFIAGAATIGWEIDSPAIRIILPVGISFYTFQTLGYAIDVYAKRLRPTGSFIDFAAYVSFFPQLVAGPIERAGRMLPQFAAARTFDPTAASDGLRQALWGFFKKVALADNAARIVGEGFQNPEAAPVVVATVAFAMQIYWDFSAYSDIAIGVGRLFGIKLSRNFAYPYFSQSLTEFWRRWHISLSTWFRDYVYIPLGGTRAGPGRVATNLLITFLLSGLWHGAAWHFVAWGLFHGLLLLAERSWRRSRRSAGERPVVPGGNADVPALVAVGRMAMTFALVCVGWVLFRAESLGDALVLLQTFINAPFDLKLASVDQDYLRGFVALGLLVTGLEWVQRRRAHPLCVERWPTAARWGLYTVLFWASLYLMPEDPHAFIYFQF